MSKTGNLTKPADVLELDDCAYYLILEVIQSKCASTLVSTPTPVQSLSPSEVTPTSVNSRVYSSWRKAGTPKSPIQACLFVELINCTQNVEICNDPRSFSLNSQQHRLTCGIFIISIPNERQRCLLVYDAAPRGRASWKLGSGSRYQFIRIKQPNIMNALVGIINEPIAAPWISRVNHRKRANIRCIDVLPRYNCRSLIFYLSFIPIDAMRC